MSFDLFLCGRKLKSFPERSQIPEIELEIERIVGIHATEIYFLQNGKKVDNNSPLPFLDVYAELRLFGGKGGFGSMLRAIGAQIEKTTNREACRDLSGRRLRDINEEKRLKTWLDSQKNRDQVTEDKQKKKIEKLQAKPKHEFRDEAYEQARMELTQNISDSVEEGFKKAASQRIHVGSKRSANCGKSDQNKKKKKKGALWLDEVSSSSDTNSDTDSESDSKNSTGQKLTLVKSPSSTITLASTSSAEVSEDTSKSSSVDNECEFGNI